MTGSRLAVGLALLAGCGDPAVDGDYAGEALFELRGLLCAFGHLEPGHTSLGVVWTTLGDDASTRDFVPGESKPTTAAELPADVGMSLFEAPPSGVATMVRSGAGRARLAIGIPVFYDDVDGDGSLDFGVDRLLGTARGEVLLHGHAASTTTASTTSTEVALDMEPLPAGFVIARAQCATAATLSGFELLPSDTRIEVWLHDGVIDNQIEHLAPETCLSLL